MRKHARKASPIELASSAAKLSVCKISPRYLDVVVPLVEDRPRCRTAPTATLPRKIWLQLECDLICCPWRFGLSDLSRTCLRLRERHRGIFIQTSSFACLYSPPSWWSPRALSSDDFLTRSDSWSNESGLPLWWIPISLSRFDRGNEE